MRRSVHDRYSLKETKGPIPAKALGPARQITARLVTVRHPNRIDRIGLHLLLAGLIGVITYSLSAMLPPSGVCLWLIFLAVTLVPLVFDAWRWLQDRFSSREEY